MKEVTFSELRNHAKHYFDEERHTNL